MTRFPAAEPADAVLTLCGDNGLVAFFGLAKPLATPPFGPPRVPKRDRDPVFRYGPDV